MGKYQGADGWVYDDGVTPRRYENREKVGPDSAPNQEKKKLTECPNCNSPVSWRREEGYCVYCGWGKGLAESSSDSSTAGVAGCLFLLGALAVCPLVGMGMGYGVGGVAGLLIGLGFGIAAPIALIIAIAASGNEDKSK
jgi:hypothetical protein